MARNVTLFTGQWADLPIETLAPMAKSFGYDGVELACWGDHFDVDRAAEDLGYCDDLKAMLGEHGLGCWSISNHLAGQLVCDLNDERSDAFAPEELAGDPEGKREWAIETMKKTARAARNFGVSVVNGFTGSSIWHLLYSFPPAPDEMIDRGYDQFRELWTPILDVFEECEVKFALEVHPTEIAFDLYSARRALEAIGNRENFGFNFDPSHLIWQGMDPAVGIASELRRCAAGLGLPVGRARGRGFRGDHPRVESHRLPGAAVGGVGGFRDGSRTRCAGVVRVREELGFRTVGHCF